MSRFERINTKKERKALEPHKSEEKIKRRRIRTESLLKYFEEKILVIKVTRQYRTSRGKTLTRDAWRNHFGSQDPMGFFSGTVSHDLVLELSGEDAVAVTIKRARIAPPSAISKIVVASFTTLGWIVFDAPKNQKGEGHYISKVNGIEEVLVNELLGALGVTCLTKENPPVPELVEGKYMLS
jgi:hypothetical protein